MAQPLQRRQAALIAGISATRTTGIQPSPATSGSGRSDAIVSLCRWYKIPVRSTCSRGIPLLRRLGELVGNGLDTIKIAGQFTDPLARSVSVDTLRCLLKGGANVSDGLESIHATGAPHLMPQRF